MLPVAAFSIPAVAVADSYLSDNFYDSSYGGDQGGWVSSYGTCYETRSGRDGNQKAGYMQIYGYIAGQFVSEFVYTENGCPDGTELSLGNGASGYENTVSLNGITVTTTCEADSVVRGQSSGTGHTKYPGEKKPYNGTYSQKYVYSWGYDCNSTATNASGDTESYSFVYVNASSYRSSDNR